MPQHQELINKLSEAERTAMARARASRDVVFQEIAEAFNALKFHFQQQDQQQVGEQSGDWAQHLQTSEEAEIMTAVNEARNALDAALHERDPKIVLRSVVRAYESLESVIEELGGAEEVRDIRHRAGI